jgi:hypothetical protein
MHIFEVGMVIVEAAGQGERERFLSAKPESWIVACESTHNGYGIFRIADSNLRTRGVDPNRN